MLQDSTKKAGTTISEDTYTCLYPNNSGKKETGNIITRQINMGSNSTYIENQNNFYTKAEAKNPARKKILFVSANPTEEARLEVDKEYRLIKAEMERGSHRDIFEFLQPQLAVTIQELVRAMNAKPYIVHFSGHGQKHGIIITDDNNNSQLLPLPALQMIFSTLQGATELVLLNSCHSAFYAEEISKFGMYVTGYPQPINDEAAIGFAQGLYIGLSEGKTFEEAFKDSMIVLLTKDAGHGRGLGTVKENNVIVEVWKDGKRLDL